MFVLKVPAVTVTPVAEPTVNALPSVHAPPTPLRIIPVETRAVPLVVIVLPVVVALKVTTPLPLQTVPAIKDIEPLIVGVPVLLNVTVPAETVKSRHVNAPVNVTV